MIHRNRYQSYDYLAVAKAIGYLMIMLGAITLIPLLMLLFYPEELYQAKAFIVPGVLSVFIGYLIKIFTAPYKVKHMKQNGGSLIVLVIWLVSVLIGLLPFLFSGNYTFTQAFFESMSGFTTTGFSVTDLPSATHMILLYRSMLQLVGGVGLVLVMTAILASVYGMQLFTAEGHVDRLTPSPYRSAQTIMIMYLAAILSGSLLYCAFGMDAFSAVNYAICAVSTGGFTTTDLGMAAYQSVPIDIVTMILMMIGGTNFICTLCLFRRDFRSFFGHVEVQMSFVLGAVLTPIILTELLVRNVCESTLEAIDISLYQTISILSTTGYSKIDNFLPFMTVALFPIVFCIFVGGHRNSTAGGIKSFRAALLFKSLFWDIRENIDPLRTVKKRTISRYGKREDVSRKEQSQNYTYIVLYIFIVFLGSYGLTLCGYKFRDSFIEFASALGNLGMPYHIDLLQAGAPALWILNAGMLISRLEVYIIILGIARLVMDLNDRRQDLEYDRRERRHRQQVRKRRIKRQINQRQEERQQTREAYRQDAADRKDELRRSREERREELRYEHQDRKFPIRRKGGRHK